VFDFRIGHNALARKTSRLPWRYMVPGVTSMPMTPTQLRWHLKRVGIAQVETARRLKVNPRTVRRWLAGDSPIPEAVAQLVALWPTHNRGHKLRRS